MKQSQEIITVNTKEVFCDGEINGNPGHPKIYLEMGNNNDIACPYCGRQFRYNPNHPTSPK